MKKLTAFKDIPKIEEFNINFLIFKLYNHNIYE